MRIAVIGGTGLAGHLTVQALQRAGHDPVVVSRSTGVDMTTGDGLDAALHGVDSVVDATSEDMAGEVLLPGPGARIAPTTFDAWLDAQR
jgi:uncharacterized protein YbjT (DUF2867 family)